MDLWRELIILTHALSFINFNKGNLAREVHPIYLIFYYGCWKVWFSKLWVLSPHKPLVLQINKEMSLIYFQSLSRQKLGYTPNLPVETNAGRNTQIHSENDGKPLFVVVKIQKSMLLLILSWKYVSIFILEQNSINQIQILCNWCANISITSLLMHNVAHSTRHSFRLKINNQPLKNFLSLAVSWVKVNNLGIQISSSG